jgi:radical SAM superfamily enzyme YgiQ (UPF0313 family)
MRILLVKAKERTDSIQPPLGLGFLAAAVHAPHDVGILDCIRLGLGTSGLVEAVKAFRADVVGVQMGTFGSQVAGDCLRAVRAALPDVWLIVGGPHPSVCPVETMDLLGPAIDFAFQGEAENGLPMLLDALEGRGGARSAPAIDGFAAIPGLVWRDPAGHVTANPRCVTDLQTAAMPRWDLLDPRTYPASPHGAFYREAPVAPVSASRGCPYSCSFCAGSLIHGRTVRYRPVAQVLDEIRRLHDEFGVREIAFVDDNLTWDVSYVHALCDGLLSLPFRIHWCLPNGVRLDRLDRALLRHMRQAGCYSVAIGIESGVARVLGNLRKGLTIDGVRRQIALLAEEGIETRGFFVLGFPGETRDEILATTRLALDLPLDFAHFMLFHPLPGTASWDEVAAEGRMDTVDWNAATFAEVAYSPASLAPGELKALHRSAFFRFYLRPSRMVRLLAQVRSRDHALQIARRVVRWLR